MATSNINSKNIVQAFGLFGFFFCTLPFLDRLSLKLLNGHLALMPQSHNFLVACLNHRFENAINLMLIFLSIMIYKPKEKNGVHYLFFILGAIIWYELFFQLIHKLERSELFLRKSPSYTFPFINLNDYVPFEVKVYASSSFPSGHGMMLGFWNALSQMLFKARIKKIVTAVSIMGCLPRLIGGAHWFTDMLAGYLLGGLICKSYSLFLKKSNELMPHPSQNLSIAVK